MDTDSAQTTELPASTLQELGAERLAQARPRETIRAEVDLSSAGSLETMAAPQEPHEPSLEHAALVSKGELELGKTLGEGGMGRVYLAQQRSLRRPIAVKMVREDQRESAAPALVREALLTGMLEHPNIPPVHQLGRDEQGNPVLLLKRIEGESWSVVLDEPDHPLRKSFPRFERDPLLANIALLQQLCLALSFAHERGVIHRDLKPENVMLGRYGEVYLIDWGIAWNAAWHRGKPVALVGSPAYMAPEQVLCEEPDARTDVYLLGASLYRVLTGRAPHDAPSLQSAMAHALSSAPLAFGPDVPEELAELCLSAMAVDREKRPQTAQAFQRRLEDFLEHRASHALLSNARTLRHQIEQELRVETPDEPKLATLATEARFALHEALRLWPHNARAHEESEALLILLVRRDLQRRNATGARELLGASHEPNTELHAQLTRLEDELRAEAARAQQLDFGTSGTFLERTFLAVAVVLVGMQLARLRSPPPTLDNARYLRQLTAVAVGGFLACTLLLGVRRTHWMGSATGRRIAALLWLTTGSVLLHRLIAWHFGQDARMMLLVDSLFLCFGWGAGGIWLSGWVALLGLGNLLVVLLSLRWPSHGGHFLNTVFLLQSLGFWWYVRNRLQSRARATNG